MLDEKHHEKHRHPFIDNPNDYITMHGETFCGAVPEDVGGSSYPHHCFHGTETKGFACCWCGDMFVGEGAHEAHGTNFHNLTPREIEVTALITEGLSNKRIADRLDVSHHTAKFHVREIMTKLKQDSRAGVAAAAIRRGIVP
jgi:DNA-binding CsgD family transcriptional regulator